MSRFRFGDPPTTDTALQDMILAHEGGIYTDHPSDHGGPTKWGITIPVLTLFRGRPCSEEDIEDLSRDDAAAIYTKYFIRPFDGLPDPLRANTIDMGVNAGVSRSTLLLQELLGVDTDGRIGVLTREAAALRDWSPLYVGFRLSFYEGLVHTDRSQGIFRKGWRNRALSFYGAPRLRVPRDPHDLRPVFGFTGKAVADKSFLRKVL